VTIHNAAVIGRDTPAPPEQRIHVFRHGTRVTVCDLFGSMPVRVKQRAVDAEKSGSAKDFDQLLLAVVALMLSRARHTFVEIQDLSGSGKVYLSTWKDTAHEGQRLPLAARTRRLLGQASLIDSVISDVFTHVEASGFGIEVYGTICLIPTATKRLQFIALEHEPLLNDHGSNTLYEEVNRVFATSAFGALEDGTDDEVLNDKEKERTSLQIKGLKTRKGVDRWPIFALQIRLADPQSGGPVDASDLGDGRSANLANIIDLLRVLFSQWLKKHHFCPKPLPSILHGGRPEESSAMPTPTASRSSSASTAASKRSRRSMSRTFGTIGSQRNGSAQPRRPGSPFASWSRVKRGRPISSMKHGIPDSAPPRQLKQPLLDGRGKLVRKPFGETVVPDPAATSPAIRQDMEIGDDSGSATQDDTIVWMDPATMTKSTINSRTGFVVGTDSLMGHRISLPSPGEMSKGTKPEPAGWIKEMLSTWRNPAFAPIEPPIIRLLDPFEAFAARTGRQDGGCTHVHLGDSDQIPTAQLQERVSRLALREAQVIAQVDAKFILVRITPQAQPLSAGHNPVGELPWDKDRELLLLIDQHAADERCKVERLQRSYFLRSDMQPDSLTPATEVLDKPMLFEVATQESLLLARFQQHFQCWGIEYNIDEQGAGLGDMARQQGKSKVRIDSLPPSILERCRLEPRVLIELMRKEVWRLCDNPGTVVSSMPREAGTDNNLEDGNGWVSRFHGCPPGILDLIYSRACRSAIMFNDHLSIDQCKDLVLRLADCAFPFQCAHGRPSMAPLLELGSCYGFGSALPRERRDGHLREKLRHQVVDSY
jgi:DNA mismatch repair protein MLH3